MESLPNEFLSHHLPLMFFAGLDPPSTAAPGEPSKQPQIASQDKFTALVENLRSILTTKSSHPTIWNPRKAYPSTPEYRVVLVPKTIRFPPRKSRPSSVNSTTSANAVFHSPLSPLSQTSPLFPNGIMTPIWVRKHRDMIPSVFVLTLKLWEPPPRTNLNDEAQDRSEHEKYDDELIYELIERKKTTSERGIKLTAIILTSRYMLDNPQLDSRLSYIRKRSSLDARASLFVLSPVPPEDVVSFVTTLKAELYESSIDYYREHSRRVRRKRSRSSSSAFTQSTVYHQPGQSVITPLGPQGWNVRSDYKLATFAEFRQEFEVAIKSYEDSWDGLVQMFNSTAVLPPRTKRWAEAKIFVDCINFKISKLYLYSNEPTRAMYQFNKHIHKFRELFNGWGIGEETFEFWSWLSKQYTVLADLIDIGCRNGMRLPNLLPPAIPVVDKNRSVGSPILPESRLVGGGAINLTGVLVHPGFYYFYAAQCAVERRDRFRSSAAAEDEMLSIAQSNGQPAPSQPSLALAHERKVNHAEMIIGLYTKAYEIFKTVGSSRMTLFLALKIALVHHHQKDHTTSHKFFERVLASYRKGNSITLIHGVLDSSYANLKGLVRDLKTIRIPESGGVAPEVIQLLKISLELIGKQSIAPHNSSRGSLCNTLSGLLQPLSDADSSSGHVVTLDIEPLAFPIRCQVAFWESSIQLGDEVEFQVLLSIPETFAICKPPMTRIDFKFTSVPMLSISHQKSQLESSHQILDVGTVSEDSQPNTLDLQVEKKSSWLITGRLKPSVVGKINLEKVIFRLDNILEGSTVDFAITPDPSEDANLHSLQWIKEFDAETNAAVFLRTEGLQSFCRVQRKDPRVTFVLNYEPFGILDERQTIQLEFYNHENDPVNLKLKLKLESPSTHDSIEFDNERFEDLHNWTFNVETLKAGQVLQKSLHLLPTGAVGLRAFEISAAVKINLRNTKDHSGEDVKDGAEAETTQDAAAAHDDDNDEKLDALRIFNISQKASVFIEELVQITFKLQNVHQLVYPLNCNIFTPAKPLNRLNFNFLISNSCQNQDRLAAYSKTLKIQNVSLSFEKSSCPIRMLSCSLKDDDPSDLNFDLNPGSSFSISYIVEVELDPTLEEIRDCFFDVTWANISSDGNATTHVKQIPLKIEMPILTPMTVLTNLKPHLRIFEPVKIDYLIENRHMVKTIDVAVKILEKTAVREDENEWILTGPKFINSLLILPRSFKSLSFVGIPTKLGLISGPKLEIFQRLADPRDRRGSAQPGTSSEPTSSLTNLKDLEDLNSDEHNTYDLGDRPGSRTGGNPPPGSDHPIHQTVSFVPVPIFRSHSVVAPRQPNAETDKDSNRPHSYPLDDLKVLVLPA